MASRRNSERDDMQKSKIVELLKVSRQYFDLDARRYRQLADEGHVPKPEKGKIDFFAATKALLLYERSLRFSKGGAEQKEAQTRRDVAKAEREELIVKKLKGELVLRNEAVKWVSLLVAECKAALWNIPRRLGPVLALISDERECEQVLRVEHRKALEELAKGMKKKKK